MAIVTRIKKHCPKSYRFAKLLSIETLETINTISSPIGFVLGVIGFVVAIRQIRKAKSSAEAAQKAADNAVAQIAKYNVVSELTKAKGSIDTVRSFQSFGVWLAVPSAYDALASILEEVQAFATTLEQNELDALNRLYDYAKDNEEFCSNANAAGQVPNGSKFNKELSTHRREVVGILARLKLEQKGEHVTE